MTIAHRIVGNGPERLLVLHGWMGDHTVFEPALPFFDYDKLSIALMDYRGYGESRGEPGDYTIDEIIKDAIGLADHLGWDKFHVLGHSMGGMAVQVMAARHRNRLHSAIAVTPVPASGFPMEGDTKELFDSAAENPDARATILGYTTGQRLGDIWEDVMVARSLASTTPKAFAGYLRAWADSDYSEEVDGCDLPMKVMVGEHDLAVTAELMWNTVMKWFPSAELEVIANAGHYPMQETPVWLAHEIMSYVFSRE